MKTRFWILMIAAVLVACISTLAQSGNSQDESSSRQLTARCAYTQSDDSCADLSHPDQGAGDDQVAQAQFPTRGPRFGSRTPRPYGPHPVFYGPYDDGHHAVIGGLIGFGAGFALGAAASQNSGSRVGTGLVAGALGTVFGAAIGHAIATFPHASLHRRHRWSDEEDQAWASLATSHDAAPRQTRQSPHAGN
jgi:hypothetical protein